MVEGKKLKWNICFRGSYTIANRGEGEVTHMIKTSDLKKEEMQMIINGDSAIFYTDEV